MSHVPTHTLPPVLMICAVAVTAVSAFRRKWMLRFAVAKFMSSKSVPNAQAIAVSASIDRMPPCTAPVELSNSGRNSSVITQRPAASSTMW